MIFSSFFDIFEQKSFFFLDSELIKFSSTVVILICSFILYLHHKKTKIERELVAGNILTVDDGSIQRNFPIFGHALSFDFDPVAFFRQLNDFVDHLKQKDPGALYGYHLLGPKPSLFVLSPEGAEAILKSTVHIRKGLFYKLFQDWLGTGLLTSHGKKWKTRRRLLTPAFHKTVLADFVEVMNEKAAKMVDILKEKIKTEKKINMHWPITLCALDIIIQTAMGAESDIQFEENNSYAQAIFDWMELTQIRHKSIWYWPDLIWNLSPIGRRQKKNVTKMHSFTKKIIWERWNHFRELKEELGDDFEATYFAEKCDSRGRMAFLDTLLKSLDRGEIDLEGIREEVDTFMFEGHDTTAAALLWAVQEIGENWEVMKKLHEEVELVFGDSDRPATTGDLDKLTFLEAVMKETLRKFPSVTMFSREFDSDLLVEKGERRFKIPAGAIVTINCYKLHRDETHWKEPEKFDPSRWLDGGSGETRYAYSYFPFSAGPRNCIGQRIRAIISIYFEFFQFANLTNKIILSHLLRNFTWKSTRKTNEIPVLAEIITRPKGGIDIILEEKHA
ncbi:Oidioi.mRNA.OKI2018_I69.chr1.g3826.t1.cds [Oikopleura dioica]|uniref:Oidioi.mRNA.OKI2018_I69.chr1.g3826.t1.cds n=1 Tax=Oikopleura dioica TaxID=34765 RepID=A0ABN7SZM1_OIKDI|nr:Oidioi.mRNA.OKI2018_I69.chr1.g3826.t1.cds [Oikopleura dioica]